MEDQDRDGPADMPRPEHPWTKIAIQEIAVDQSIPNRTKYLEFTRMDPPARLSGRTGPQTHR